MFVIDDALPPLRSLATRERVEEAATEDSLKMSVYPAWKHGFVAATPGWLLDEASWTSRACARVEAWMYGSRAPRSSSMRGSLRAVLIRATLYRSTPQRSGFARKRREWERSPTNRSEIGAKRSATSRVFVGSYEHAEENQRGRWRLEGLKVRRHRDQDQGR